MNTSPYCATICPQDVDMTLRASLSTFIGILLGFAGEDATRNGFGVDAINQENHTWVLSRFAVECSHLPALGDTLEVSTWISGYNRLLSTRLFSIASPSSVVLGEAISQWCMMDMSTRRAIDLTTLHQSYARHVHPTRGVSIATPRKLPAPEAFVSRACCVEYSDVDFNGHLNSLRYIELMLNMLPLELLRAQRPLRMELNFLHECYLGEELRIDYQQSGELSTFEILKSESSTPAARCQIEWR